MSLHNAAGQHHIGYLDKAANISAFNVVDMVSVGAIKKAFLIDLRSRFNPFATLYSQQLLYSL